MSFRVSGSVVSVVTTTPFSVTRHPGADAPSPWKGASSVWRQRSRPRTFGRIQQRNARFATKARLRVAAGPLVHGDTGRDAGVDRPRRAELPDVQHHLCRLLRSVSEAGSFLSE